MIRTVAWALFDLANTFFAVAMLSFHFPLWVVEDRGARELSLSIALGLSMACVAAIMPFAGAVSDAAGRRMQFVRWTTYGCTVATALVGMTSHLGLALLLFGLANICYQLGTIFYDALLWDVATRDRLGAVSGFGAAFGYLGSILGMVLLGRFLQAGNHQAAFAPCAGYFLLFALPSFLLIREAEERRPVSWGDVVRSALLRLAMTIRSARALSGLWRYLWASLFSFSAINTVLVFMAVYTRKVVGFSEAQIIRYFLLTQVCAVAGSLSFGVVIRRLGAKRTLLWIWCGWMGALALVAVNPSVQWLWVAGPMMGFCLGSTWATSRVLITELSPKDQLAEMFGLAGLVGRVSAILGPFLWGVLVWEPSGYRLAILSLVGLLAVGIWLLRGVPPAQEGAIS